MKEEKVVGYYVNPVLFGSRVVFVCEEDLWEVSDQGGVARRMTSGRGGFSHAQFSPDGHWLAVSALEEGPREIFLMPSTGGELKRLTFLNSISIVRGWDHDEVVFSTRAFDPNQEDSLATVSRYGGGSAKPLNWGQATRRAVLDNGDLIIERNAGRNDAAHWKRYRGGTAGKFYQMTSDQKRSSRFLQKLKGNLSCPMWVGGRLYFLSDHEGVGNLYSVLKSGSGLKRHTHFRDYYVRNPSTDGLRIVFHSAGDIYLFDPQSDEVKKLQIQIYSQRTQHLPRRVPAMDHLETVSPHPAGHTFALTSRGQILLSEVKSGPCLSLASDFQSRVRDRLAAWCDENTLAFVTDQEGDEKIGVVSATAPQRRRLLKADVGRVVDMKPSPDGKFVALSNHRNELLVVDLKTGRSRVVHKETFGLFVDFEWAPDSAWVAFVKYTNPRTQVVSVWNLKSGKAHVITREAPGFRAPRWSSDGKLLFVLGSHNFNPRYEPMRFSLFFEAMERPYCILLAADSKSPLVGATAPVAEKSEKSPKAKPPKVKVGIDFDGIDNRLIEIPVLEKNYTDLVLDQKSLILFSKKIEGSRAMEFQAKSELLVERFVFDSEKTETIGSGVQNYGLSLSGEWVLVASEDRLRMRRISDWTMDGKHEEGDSATGWIQTARLQLQINSRGEWQQIFDETWRMQRQFFWDRGMGGIDWDLQRKKYRPLLSRISMRSELSDLLWELIGELGVSHAYMMGGDLRQPPAHQAGALGAEFLWNPKVKGWEIQKILSGYPWKVSESSPLWVAGVRPGDVITSVNRAPVKKEVLISEMLVGHARAIVELEVVSSKSRSKSKVVRVKTLRDDFGLKYRHWVESNRQTVSKATQGKVGYIHVPDMGPDGYAEFFEQYLKEFDKDGLIVDVRFNGGGHVSALLLGRLLQKRVGFDQGRWFGTAPYPGEAPAGPIVALTNEFAGSDGDIFSHAFKLYKLGPLIGTRTWGGVIGIWPRHHLVDGGLTTQPEFAFWFQDVGWDVEGHGTEPDIEVDILPHEFVRGKDPQLERGIETVIKQIQKNPPLRPQFGPLPKRAPRIGF